VQQEGGITRGQKGSAREGNATTSFVVFHRTTSVIHSIVIFYATMALRGVVVCHSAMAIHGIVFDKAAMSIGSVIFFGHTAGTLVVGIVVFRPHHLGNTQQTPHLAKIGMRGKDLFHGSNGRWQCQHQ
jgi:hypothetical protein